ncbi:threonine/serine ThrE exporter family protein [Aestuariibacter salexigens]|uniref:threonine/serine ThrE exporter family protein n=1 Tax=Aestuariibacter salexigens TaxID=226010 RepID=UPI00040613E0|nr:threonine/serine exporter family protein [Aestuariibacter salexigens]
MDKAKFTQIRRFIVKLGRMLHKYETPSFRLEAHLMEVASYLGVRASFNSTPTSIIFMIWSEGHEDEYTHAARLEPGELDLGSLGRIDELVSELLSGKLTIDEADQRLTEIDNSPGVFHPLVSMLAYGMTTGAFALLMGASWHDVGWTAMIGPVMFLFVAWSGRSKRVKLMLEPAVAMVAGLIACFVNSYIDGSINVRLVVLSSIIIFIPGLALTIGLAELSSRHVVSGTSRVMDAVMQLFKLYFGAFLGITLGAFLFQQTDFIPADPHPIWTRVLGVFVLCSALVVIFKLRFKHAPWAIIAGFIAYFCTYFASQYLEFGLGTFVGAFALGVYANAFTRFANAPASIVMMQGLIVLVPGSKTYIGLNQVISGQEFIQAEHVGQETFVILMSLVAGLIFANVVMPTKKAL